MFTARPGGKPVRCLLLDRRKQYDELMRIGREASCETAILYRNNESAIPVVYRLLKEGIPFRSRGMDGTFFSTPAVQFLKDVFRFAYVPGDCDVFLRIYWKLECFIKKEEALLAVRLCQQGQAENPLEALLRMDSVAEYNKERIRRLKGSLMSIRNRNASASVSGFTQLFDFHKDEERYFVLSHLAEPQESSAEYLEKLNRLQQLLEEGNRDPGAKLILSTIHSSKGLEYDRVVLMDAVDGILPSEDGDLEEERRLFYVASTRAREELILFSYKDKQCQFFQEFLQRTQEAVSAKSKGNGCSVSAMPASRPSYRKGSKIRHDRFGCGTVKSCSDTMVEIEFKEHGRKKFLREVADHFITADS